MIVRRVVVGPLQVNCWIVGEEDGPVVVIDPGDDAAAIREAVGERPVAGLVLTHAHFDHVGAVVELKAETGAPVYVHVADAGRLTSPAAHGTGGALFGFDAHVPQGADRLVEDGDNIAVGGLTLEVLHTPGHTEGGMSLLVDDPGTGERHLFSGDTLFSGSVGRTDFPGGDGRVLSRSIASRLAGLDAETVVHPGHGPDTTIGREARINPFWPRG